MEAKNKQRLRRQRSEMGAALARLEAVIASMEPGDRPRSLFVYVEPPKHAGDTPHVQVRET